MKFLIVDDSRAMHTIIKRSLVGAGYGDHSFKTALDGEEAINIIKEWKPDLVLSDWHMPKMDGIQLIKAINRQKLGVKIGLITTERSMEKIKYAKAEGAIFVVSKPFTVETLNEALVGALGIEEESDESHKQPKFILPKIDDIKKLLMSLLDTQVSPKPQSGQVLTAFPIMIAIYADNMHKARAVCMLDLNMAVIIGCCLVRVPFSTSLEYIREKSIPSDVFDNSSECLNVFSGLTYNPDEGQDLTLKSVHLTKEMIPPVETIMKQTEGEVLNLVVNVEGYGKGNILFASL